MADNKVNFLRGTSAEYESSIKDNDTFYYTTDDEKLYLGNKEITGGGVTVDDTLSDTSKNPVQNKIITNALNTKANLTDIPTTLPADGGNADTLDGKHADDFALKTDIPTTLPANGGNAATVNGHSVNSDVPTGAKFTDTTYGVATTSANGLMSSTDKSKLDGIATGANKYTHPSYTARTGVPTANVAPAFGGTFTVSQPVSDATGHITAINSRTITIPSTVASASAAGLVSTGAQTFAGNKTFKGQVIPAGASAVGTAQARKIYAGTSDMTAGTTKLETGAIYLVYE